MICISIPVSTTNETLRLMQRAFSLADMVELRIDGSEGPDLERLLAQPRGPCLVTNRSRREGGRHSGSENERCELIAQAVDLGAEYVDLELATEGNHLDPVINRVRKSGGTTRVILSYHDFLATPTEEHLQSLVAEALDRGAHMVKIAAMAVTMEDNLRILNFLHWGQRRKHSIIAFCMGQMGKISRLAAPLFGSPITYASIERGCESAPGQLTANEVRRWLEIMR